MDIEKTMEFILDHQAKFFAGMEEARRRQDRFDEQLSALGDQLSGLGEYLSAFAERQEKINGYLGKAMLGLTDHIDRLTAAQAATDERLNGLIGVVDQLVRRPPAA